MQLAPQLSTSKESTNTIIQTFEGVCEMNCSESETRIKNSAKDIFSDLTYYEADREAFLSQTVTDDKTCDNCVLEL
jgi:hypothetical protein